MLSRLRRLVDRTGRTPASEQAAAGAEPEPAPSRWRPRRLPPSLALALTCYVPLLATHRGKLGADTKAYLYLDPARLMARAAYLWDPSVGLGTVTHQNIGYLFPMGPYYWLCEAIGLPDWVAQRLWIGSIMFVAGLGVAALLRTLRWTGSGIWIAAFAYGLSPYLLHYVYKHSVILLPYAALGWLIHFTARSLREGTWRAPALFALTCLWSGGINATSLLLALIGPFLWVAHAVFVEHELRLRAAVAPLLRIGVLTAATSLWWVAGLVMQGRYGINVLRYTETYKTVADASSAPEIVRGYGYWFFYGTDILGPWFKAAVTMTQSVPALALSLALPIVSVAAALWTRFRYRVFFVGLGLAGFVASVGAHPFTSPSPYGALFSAFTRSDSGLAMRSTPRAIPLLALALAVFLAAGCRAVIDARPQLRLGLTLAVLGLVIANLSPLWTGRMVDEYLERPEDVPAYWTEAGRELNASDGTTRALEIPGIDFANYRWGATVDPITPGLTDRDYAARELVPYGSEASADFMNAIDAPLGDGSFDRDSYASLLRLAGVGELVERHDLEYERYRTPRPRILAAQIDATSGLEAPRVFGPPDPNVPNGRAPLVDDLELSRPDSLADPEPVRIRSVADPLPLVRLAPARGVTVMSGSAAGVVSMAESHRLDPDRTLLYSGSVTDDPVRLRSVLDAGARLVVTDTNRKTARRWGTTRDNDGATETADQTPAVFDPTDNRIELFRSPDGSARGSATKTVVAPRGGIWATASGYGNELTFTPSDRPANAIDGDPTSAWKVSAQADPRGQWIELALDEPVTTDHLRLVQASRYVNRYITRAELSFDGGDPVPVELGQESRGGDGQTIPVGVRTFSHVRLTVRGTDLGEQPSYRGVSGVGFAEIDVEGRRLSEVVRPPTDLIDAAGADLADHDLTYVLRRVRSEPHEAVLSSPEPRLLRQIDLPQARDFAVSGRARLAASLSDDRVDALLGRPGAESGGVTVTTSGRLAGDLVWRGSKAIDGDPATAWQSNIFPEPGAALSVTAPAPVAATLTGLQVMADGRHSIPRQVRVVVPGQPDQTSAVSGEVRDGARGDRAALTFDTPISVIAASFTLVVDRIEDRTSRDWLSGRPVRLPIGIAEVSGSGIPTAPPMAERLAPDCRSDLLTVGGTPVALELDGDTAGAEAGEAVTVRACPGSPPASLPAGATLITSTDGRTTGIDVDSLVLDSPRPADAALPVGADDAVAGTGDLVVDRIGRLTYDLAVDRLEQPAWLVLGQSHNDGWHLSVDGRDLGPPSLVNGYANGWLLDPAELGASPHLVLEWTPQAIVWFALAASGIAAALCLVLALRSRGRPEPLRGEPMSAHRVPLLDRFGEPPSWRTTGIATLGAAVAGGLFIGPFVGTVALGAAMLLALRTRWGWPALRLTCLALLVLAAGYITLRQWRSGYQLDFDWPQHFELAHSPTMVAFGLLGVECVVEAIRAGWRRRTGLRSG